MGVKSLKSYIPKAKQNVSEKQKQINKMMEFLDMEEVDTVYGHGWATYQLKSELFFNEKGQSYDQSGSDFEYVEKSIFNKLTLLVRQKVQNDLLNKAVDILEMPWCKV